MPETQIAPSRLVELRTEGRAKIGPFVDPHVLLKCKQVIASRGEAWAAEILGRDLSRRSLMFSHLPFLANGDEYTLVAADQAEDEARFSQIVDGVGD